MGLHLGAPAKPSGERAAAHTVPGEPLIAFQDVRVAFDGPEILGGISFEVWPGETKILLGESGSGKTTILKLAAGLLHPDSGRVWVMGHDLGEMRERELLEFRRNIGFVFQEGALFDSLSVAENVAFPLREEHLPEREIEERIWEALRFVELEEAIEKYPAELSGGMRRRVSIARALVSDAPLVFYDSPTAGLDPVTSQTIITLILRHRDLQGVTSLLATHRVQDAFGLSRFRFDAGSGRVARLETNGGARTVGPGAAHTAATNVLVLHGGTICFEGSAEELLESKDEYLRQFLASAE